MMIENLMIANAAEIKDDLLYVSGAGWEHIQLPMLPGNLAFWVAGIVSMDDDDLGEDLSLNFTVGDSQGLVDRSRGSMLVSSLRPKTISGVPNRSPFAIILTTIVRGPTVVEVTVSGAFQSKSVTFAVLDPIPDTAPAG